MAMQRDTSGNPLFLAVTYTIIRSDKINEEEEDNLKELLQQGDAEFVPLRPDGRIKDTRNISHIVSETVDFPDYYSALDANIQVVKPSWVYTSMDKKRQSQTRQHSPDPAMFFSQVVLSCADLPEGDKDAIIAGVLAMGGLYSSPLTKLVTHIATLDTDNPKCSLAMEKMPGCNIVLPHWFDDCFRLGKLINAGPYRFPNPEILQISNDPVRARQTPDIEGATSAVGGKPPKYQAPQSPSQSRKSLSVFEGKKILFSRDLNVNEHLAKTLHSLVEQAGGEMTVNVDDCDVYIGHYRDGTDYVDASQAGKEVANLSWFYNVINRNRWTNPLSKLLHYPVPRDGVAGFKGMRISLSNYTGDARIYLENLVKEAGAEFTKTMKQDNTHLITAHKQSEKCEAAQEWNINIINHLWLEESYSRCEAQSMTDPRYTHFPPRTNLSEIVGQTPVNMERVKRFYFATKEKTIRDVERGLLEPKNGLTPHPYRGAVPPQRSPRKTVPASSAVPATAPEESSSNAPVETMETVHEEDEETPAPQTAKKARSSRATSDAETPARKLIEEKENETPPTTGRASKNRALNAMHKQREDIALFQREMKRKGGVIHGGRKVSEDDAADSAKKATTKGRKRASTEGPENDEEAETGNGTEEEAPKPAARQTKKARKSDKDGEDSLPPIKYRMLVTGDSRWQGKAKKEDDDARKLRKLGVSVVTEPADCNILCAPKMLRTPKFVAALAVAPQVVSTDWLDHLLKPTTTLKNQRQPEENLLIDRDFEEKWGFRLSDSLERAEQNQRRLLRGWTVYVTDKVPKGFDIWRDFITINGGTATIYRGRTGLTLAKPRVPPSDDKDAGPEQMNQGPNADDEVDVAYLVSGTEEDEVKLWKTFRAQTEKQGLRARIVQTEWVLHFAMAQRLEWDAKWECREDTVPGYKEKYGR